MVATPYIEKHYQIHHAVGQQCQTCKYMQAASEKFQPEKIILGCDCITK